MDYVWLPGSGRIVLSDSVSCTTAQRINLHLAWDRSVVRSMAVTPVEKKRLMRFRAVINSVHVVVLSHGVQKLTENRFVWYGSRKLQLPLLGVGCLDTPAAAQMLFYKEALEVFYNNGKCFNPGHLPPEKLPILVPNVRWTVYQVRLPGSCRRRALRSLEAYEQ